MVMAESRKRAFPGLLLLLSLAACGPLVAQAHPAPVPATFSSDTPYAAEAGPAPTATPTLPPLPAATLTPTATGLSADDWQSWPLLPSVPAGMRAVYQLGQQLGNDPHAFSVFGDCQSEPNVFLGVYDRDPKVVAALPLQLQETVANFAGSFNRRSPTIRGGTSAAALLWPDWHQGNYGCGPKETPVACELRIHRPSFVVIHVGTHFEERSPVYLQRILRQLLDQGVVPILATKADDRGEGDHVNRDYAALALQYGLPLWNFWPAVSALPNRGLYTMTEVRYLGDIHLNATARLIHRYTALLALDAVWRAVRGQ